MFRDLTCRCALPGTVGRKCLSPVGTVAVPLGISLAKMKIRSKSFGTKSLNATLSPCLSDVTRRVRGCYGSGGAIMFLPLMGADRGFESVLGGRKFETTRMGKSDRSETRVLRSCTTNGCSMLYGSVLLARN